LPQPSKAILDSENYFAFNISVKKALQQMPDLAKESMTKELAQLHQKGVWIPQDHTFRATNRPIRSFMFLKEKRSSSGAFEKVKARLVADGSHQDRSQLSFEDVSSATVHSPFVFMVAAIAAKESRKVRIIDIAGAYLNADISQHQVYMELDSTMVSLLIDIDPLYKTYVRPNGSIVVLLVKALYGCIESAKLWFDLISSFLKDNGFKSNPIDPCVLNKTVHGSQCTVLLYVDDLFISCVDSKAIDDLESLLKTRFQEITVKSGTIVSYLGMTFDFSTFGQATVTMEGFISDLLEFATVTGSAVTPASSMLFEVRESPLLDPTRTDLFHSLVARVLYLAKRCRPDLLLPTSFLSTRVQSPDTDDWSKLQRMLKYLSCTQDLGITLVASDPLCIYAHIDASYGVHATGKSHTGMFVTLGSGPILVNSSKQHIVTKSSTEAELVALSDMCSSVIWTRDFLLSQGYDIPPAIVYQDNQSAMALISKGHSTSQRTRHVHVRYFWVKDRISSGELTLLYLPSSEMTADILTKPMQGEQFKTLRRALMS
jgi:hypothetical protein